MSDPINVENVVEATGYGFERDEAKRITAVIADGKRYPLAKLKLAADWPKFEQAYSATLAPPADAMVEQFESLGASPALQGLLADRLYRDMREAAKAKKGIIKPPRQEVIRWINTYDGMMFSWWLQMKPATPNITIDEVEEIVSAAGAADAEYSKMPEDKRVEAALNAANPDVQKLVEDSKNAETLQDRVDALEENGVPRTDALKQMNS